MKEDAKQTAIQEHLAQFHVGEANAIHCRELQNIFCLDGRTVRRKINRLRQEGVPICSNQHGYYYADTQAEISETVSRLNAIVMKITNARTGLLYSCEAPCGNGLGVRLTLELFEEEPNAE